MLATMANLIKFFSLLDHFKISFSTNDLKRSSLQRESITTFKIKII